MKFSPTYKAAKGRRRDIGLNKAKSGARGGEEE